MSDAFDDVMNAMDEALSFAKGEDTGARVHHSDLPTPDVAAIRRTTGLSQAEFARMVCVAAGTLKGWEQGRRTPNGPARVLLALIANRPSIVQDELAKLHP